MSYYWQGKRIVFDVQFSMNDGELVTALLALDGETTVIDANGLTVCQFQWPSARTYSRDWLEAVMLRAELEDPANRKGN